jgi:hypothetical protein
MGITVRILLRCRSIERSKLVGDVDSGQVGRNVGADPRRGRGRARRRVVERPGVLRGAVGSRPRVQMGRVFAGRAAVDRRGALLISEAPTCVVAPRRRGVGEAWARAAGSRSCVRTLARLRRGAAAASEAYPKNWPGTWSAQSSASERIHVVRSPQGTAGSFVKKFHMSGSSFTLPGE